MEARRNYSVMVWRTGSLTMWGTLEQAAHPQGLAGDYWRVVDHEGGTIKDWVWIFPHAPVDAVIRILNEGPLADAVMMITLAPLDKELAQANLDLLDAHEQLDDMTKRIREVMEQRDELTHQLLDSMPLLGVADLRVILERNLCAATGYDASMSYLAAAVDSILNDYQEARDKLEQSTVK